ncbi:unnamed protein product [Arabidopsis halleri]
MILVYWSPLKHVSRRRFLKKLVEISRMRNLSRKFPSSSIRFAGEIFPNLHE